MQKTTKKNHKCPMIPCDFPIILRFFCGWGVLGARARSPRTKCRVAVRLPLVYLIQMLSLTLIG